MDERISVQDLHIQYADVVAVRSATFTVGPGEVLGLLGGNGAGKSSTLRAVAGVYPVRSGRLFVAGHDMGDPSEANLGRKKLGYCPDVGGLLRSTTPRDHIEYALRNRDRKDLIPKAHALVDLFDLGYVMDRATIGFSHGMCRRLSVLLAAVTATDVLVLDEPFDGVDPTGVKATFDVVQEAKAQGCGILVSTHLLNLLTDLCDRIAVMRLGELVEVVPAAMYAGEAGAARYEHLLRAAVAA